ncbi:hypothetical protein B0H17DRAFT_1177608 [Mycena rosella]|uniref:Uncharacterized protein n=1 Tax=Mycena rosella TaxID=1033263 RepID=A0AAD7DTE0_MYCRO|nr:hypothetical protein B0H17DRAFT_1177608 [Mycena rosella]
MRIPQELIDAIIAEFDEQFDAETKATLQACALVARSFVRVSQTQLFSRISVYDYDQNPTILSQQLAELLARAPHLAGYIRTLDLYYNRNTPEAQFVSRIFCAVTQVHTLILTSSFKEPFPIDTSILAVFALPSLRRVELIQYRFANVQELGSLLRRSRFLQDLSLCEVDFSGDECAGRAPSTDESASSSSSSSRVVLKALTLVKMEPIDVEMMLELDSFTTVDINHLHSLSFTESPVTGLLRANAGSIQTVKIGNTFRSFENSNYEDEIDRGMLACDNQLSSLDFETEDLESVLIALPLFGDLTYLKALKTIRIALSEPLREDAHEAEQWAELDALLAQCRGPDSGSFGNSAKIQYH